MTPRITTKTSAVNRLRIATPWPSRPPPRGRSALGAVGGSRSAVSGTPDRTWETRSQVVVAGPAQQFAFVVGGTFVRWGYRLTPAAEATEVTESWEFFPSGIAMFHANYGDDAAAQRPVETLVPPNGRRGSTRVPATARRCCRCPASRPGPSWTAR